VDVSSSISYARFIVCFAFYFIASLFSSLVIIIYMYVGYVHCNKNSIVKSTDVKSLFSWTLYRLIERFEVIPINLNWYEATRYCQKRQGHLVVIQDEKKQVIVEEMLAQTLHKRASCKYSCWRLFPVASSKHNLSYDDCLNSEG